MQTKSWQNNMLSGTGFVLQRTWAETTIQLTFSGTASGFNMMVSRIPHSSQWQIPIHRMFNIYIWFKFNKIARLCIRLTQWTSMTLDSLGYNGRFHCWWIKGISVLFCYNGTTHYIAMCTYFLLSICIDIFLLWVHLNKGKNKSTKFRGF